IGGRGANNHRNRAETLTNPHFHGIMKLNLPFDGRKMPMRRLLRYLKGYEKETVLAPLFKMLEACFELLVPLVVAALVDTGIGRGDVPFIWGQFGILVLLAAVGLAASATAQYFAAKSALGYGTALR